MANLPHFDFAIIGNGLAGLQLALAFSKDPFFSEKTITLIDPSEKNTNDKTWSFWETGSSYWGKIAQQSWSKAIIYACEETISLDLQPYNYKSIRSIDFYKHCKAELGKHQNIRFVLDEVTEVIEDATSVSITGKKKIYRASQVFDSRLPEEFFQPKKNIPEIIQHFKGYIIKTETQLFDENIMTMMDYRVKDGDQTTFTYVLPYSKTEALVEFTYFTKDLVENDVYDEFLKRYIKEYLHPESYTIVETETGRIPMSAFPFDHFNSEKITKIGTAGGWVKASTGYSFKNTENKVNQIISNLKQGKRASESLFKSKYKFYDKVFLHVLKDNNEKGEWIFKQFYGKNKTSHMFRFLDEESSILEDIRIMISLISWPFIKAFFKTLR
ncbi:lycopene cyclase family protein [Gaetbulibacter sp. M240]|uniref:lycopene cyclase family protein n=1 Tax=Gaetbulibacter sp. M240 TaxID=3126511 RepID=UPI00374F2A2F